MGERLVVEADPDTESPWTDWPTLRDPTAADLVAFLQARPELAVEVVDRLKVARAWLDHPNGGEAYRCSLLMDPLATAGIDPRDGTTHYWMDDQVSRHHERGMPDGRAAADAALVAAGWALAGEP
jgi:hypothetical protein